MNTPRYDRPENTEYAPYYGTYIGKVPDGDLLRGLEAQSEQTMTLLSGVPESKGGFAYAPGKWTLKEVVGHMTDAERVFSYRALRIARGDTIALPGFDQEPWVPNSGANARTLADLLGEFRVVRASTLALLRHLPPESVTRVGTASDKPISVRALAWIIAGHERHHLGIVRERYLS